MPSKKKKWPSGTPRYWSTKDELEYLKGIGTHYKSVFNRMTRAEWLRRYRRTMENRVKWETMNPNEIAEYIDKELGGMMS